MAHSIATNTVIASAGRAINIVAGIIVTAAITRYLGVEGYGAYALLLSLGALLQIAADFGLYLTLTKEIATHPEQEQEYVQTISGLRLALLVTVFAIGLGVLIVLPQYMALTLPFAVVAIGLTFQSLSQLLMGVYQKYAVVWRVAVGDLLGRAAQLIGVLMFPAVVGAYPWTQGGRLLYMAAAFTGGAGIAYVMHVILAPSVRAWRVSLRWSKWVQIAKYSFPLGAMLILNAVYFRTDIVMLSWFRGEHEVGLYGLAYRIIESSLFVPAMFGGLLLPRLSALLASKKKEKASELVGQGVFMMISAAALVGSILAVYAHPIIVLLSGEAFAPAALLVQILTIALVVMYAGNVFGFTLVALEERMKLLALYAALAVGNVIANLVTIPRFGALAASWTTVVTECVAMIVAAYVVRRHLPIKLSTRAIVGLGAVSVVAISAAILLPHWWHVIIRIGVVVVLFAATGVLANVWRVQDMRMLLISQRK